MSFTNITIVRKHLTDFRRPENVVENLLLRLSGDEPVELPHKGIKPGTEKVKGKEYSAPEYEKVVLGVNPVSLGYHEIIGDSVVVASDQSLTRIYNENVDYLIDYSSGTIERLESGEIQFGDSVSVWYYPYRLYVKDTDYSMDYTAGKIALLPEGSLESGQIVWVDYEIEAGMFSDEIVARAIEEADAMLKAEIADEYLESADDLIVVAETYLAIDILARMKGLEILQSQYVNPTQKGMLGNEYLALGESYRKQAETILDRYRKSPGSLSFPLKIRNNP
jgi:hypothetical protein